MGNYKEDNNKSFRTLFFLVLFSLLVLASSNNQENHNSSSAKFTRQNELVSVVYSTHNNPAIVNTVSLYDFLKYCEYALRNTSPDLFSFRNISDFNHKIVQTFIQIRKKSLSIVPGLSLRLFLQFHSNRDDNLPVLS